jgi:hypothetical protein
MSCIKVADDGIPTETSPDVQIDVSLFRRSDIEYLNAYVNWASGKDVFIFKK